jgi:antitoxin component YwqK of YwqJK toxin-antitoxin module
MSLEVKCKAITEAGIQCSRNAVINGYCTQHYKKLEQELPPDITNNILSDYIEIEELKELENEFEGLKLDPKRIKIIEEIDEHSQEKQIITYYDNELIKIERFYPNGKIEYEKNYKNGKTEGKQYSWYPDGKKNYESNYKNGKAEGKQYSWYDNGEKYIETNYKNGKRSGKQYYWCPDGEIYSEVDYV